MRSRTHLAAVPAAVLTLVLGLLVATAAPGAARPSEPRAAAVAADRRTADERSVDRAPVPRIEWGPCASPQQRPVRRPRSLECATIRVPLDYDRPRGATTPLSVQRLKAAQPRRRIGSLFVNPGGPGGSSADFVYSASLLLGPRATARFDIVGVDPRGVGGSGRTVCRGAIATPALAFPIGRRQARDQVAADDTLRRACARDATALVRHASTADVARDMDLVRRALGDRQLTYYGISYGSYLGSTYAAMFPQRVRALVIDGVLDPVAWSTGTRSRPVTVPQTTRLRSGFGAYEAMTSALTECDRVGPARCPLAPDALGAWRRVLAAARDGRLVVDDTALTYQELVGLALGSLYDRDGIRFMLRLLAQLDEALDAAATRSPGSGQERRVEVGASDDYRRVLALRDALADRGLYAAPALSGPGLSGPGLSAPAARDVARANVQFPAVLCSDGRNPRAGTRWEKASVRADRASPWFGRLWTWASSPCAKGGLGSSSDAFRGPWPTRTSYPLLIVGNTHDPATPISGARRANTLFRDSVLLTYDAWGHGALGGGGCVTGIMTAYLVDRRLPRDGTVCKQPRPLLR